MLAPICAIAASDVEFTNQMLDSEIERLTQQRDEKFAALQKCEETTKGFKIAGITTLAVTGVGVYGNIKLSQKAVDCKIIIQEDRFFMLDDSLTGVG